jgi:DNA-binding transcriptional LysR family regulator
LKLNLRSLESFREIMRMGSVTAAAKQLGLSQPAVSRLLAQLEHELGFKVFHRHKGRLSPTPQALMLFEEVDLAFQGLERVTTLASDINHLNAGHLRVVAVPSFAEGPLVALMADFMAGRDNIHVMVDSRSRPTSLNMVATRGVDCGFAKAPVDHPSIRVRPLVTSGTVCALPAGHPLLAHAVLTPKDLALQPLILIGQGGDTRLRIDEMFRDAGVIPHVRLETHNIGAACAFAGAGVGIAIVNDLLAQHYRHSGIELRPLKPRIAQDYVFITAAGVPESALTEAFYVHCRKGLAARRRDGATAPKAGKDTASARN